MLGVGLADSHQCSVSYRYLTTVWIHHGHVSAIATEFLRLSDCSSDHYAAY